MFHSLVVPGPLHCGFLTRSEHHLMNPNFLRSLGSNISTIIFCIYIFIYKLTYRKLTKSASGVCFILQSTTIQINPKASCYQILLSSHHWALASSNPQFFNRGTVGRKSVKHVYGWCCSEIRDLENALEDFESTIVSSLPGSIGMSFSQRL